jgi:LruC domain-containing protein
MIYNYKRYWYGYGILLSNYIMKASSLYLKTAIIIALAMVVLAACQKKIESDPASTNNNVPNGKISPEGFNFATEKRVTVNLSLLTNNNSALTSVPVTIYGLGQTELTTALFSGVCDMNGKLSTILSIPAGIDTLIIDPVYPGLLRRAKAVIRNEAVNAIIGGSEGYLGNIVGSMEESKPIQLSEGTFRSNDLNGVSTRTSFSYVTRYDGSGRPTELATSDVISSEMLKTISNSLPERDVRLHHPEYLESRAEPNIVVDKDADVWITFVSEGAGYMNSIGFYTYPTGRPPTALADITDIKFIFPNASLKGSNGTMLSGDKVKIGRFTAGTTIGFVLFANGWTGRDVDITRTAYFTNQNLNPERDANLKRHTVLLEYNDRFLIGFEDLNRETGSDNDFNDAIFYASTNPIDAISRAGVAVADIPTDTDGDGIYDDVDQYPTDASRAYINYYPTKTTWATMAFEDQWPIAGDYDMNDLVVNYQYAWVTNASNQVVELFGNFAPVASGASFANGLGIQFPFAPSAVASVTGQRHTENYIQLSSNGTESNQTNAVIIPFDNHRSIINNVGGAFFINTKMDMPKITGDTVKVRVNFTNPLSIASFGSAPFNPFLISDLRRGYEVHLPMQRATNLADITQFGKGVDATNPSSNIYYVTKENYPWGLNFTSTFIYPSEQNSIANGYPNFLKWAASNGTQFTDWFTSTATGYRNTSLLYTK